MSKTYNTTNDIARVAIDISKHRHDILIAVPGKKRRFRMTIRNTKEDFERLGVHLNDFAFTRRFGVLFRSYRPVQSIL